jgi:hypothetical protein
VAGGDGTVALEEVEGKLIKINDAQVENLTRGQFLRIFNRPGVFRVDISERGRKRIIEAPHRFFRCSYPTRAYFLILPPLGLFKHGFVSPIFI